MAAHQQTVRLGVEARRGWDRYVTANGVTLAATFEALGRMLDDHSLELPQAVADLAHAVDFERRSRR